jgi:hypothetical protein
LVGSQRRRTRGIHRGKIWAATTKEIRKEESVELKDGLQYGKYRHI